MHAYICDLRELPYSEQLHWVGFNEAPKAHISERAYINDFRGEFVDTLSPLEKVLSVIRRWHSEKVLWWQLRDEALLSRVNVPYSPSRDEWAESFMDLAKLVSEGFDTKYIRGAVSSLGVSFDATDQSIALLEKLCRKTNDLGRDSKFFGLRAVQRVRSKVKGHSGSSEALEIRREALAQHGSFAAHFEHACEQVSIDLRIIERGCAPK